MKLKKETLENLRIAKGKNNLSIMELAQNIGTSRYTIGSIINGRTDGLSKQTINKIDAYLAKDGTKWDDYIKHSKTGFTYQME